MWMTILAISSADGIVDLAGLRRPAYLKDLQDRIIMGELTFAEAVQLVIQNFRTENTIEETGAHMKNVFDKNGLLGDDEKFSSIPVDFPKPEKLGALPGSQPKILVVEYNGRFYPSGCTPPDLIYRWELCEDLARQLATKSVESKAGKRSHMTETDILAQYLPRLMQIGWASKAEANWIICRVAQILDWPVPIIE